jgi:hypothetical protein
MALDESLAAEIVGRVLRGVSRHPYVEEFTERFARSMKGLGLATLSGAGFVQAMQLTCAEFPWCVDYRRARYIALANLVAVHLDDLVANGYLESADDIVHYATSSNPYIRENRAIFSLMSDMPCDDLRRFRLQYEAWRHALLLSLGRSASDRQAFGVQDYLYWRTAELGYQLIRVLLPYSLGRDNHREDDLAYSLAAAPFEYELYLLTLVLNDLMSHGKELASEVFPANLLGIAAGQAAPENIAECVRYIYRRLDVLEEKKTNLVRDFPRHAEITVGSHTYSLSIAAFYLMTDRYVGGGGAISCRPLT